MVDYLFVFYLTFEVSLSADPLAFRLGCGPPDSLDSWLEVVLSAGVLLSSRALLGASRFFVTDRGSLSSSDSKSSQG